ncbi:MAG: nucleoside monophosphate kinase [Candidatus Nomurabacteria bacterium]|nr:nucleoside monophosphate kinase [Candidatus Nomurabacteria bacterium]
MTDKPRTIIFFGRSGSGKGTQAQLLMDKLQSDGRETVYIETGSEFRKFVEQKNYTAGLTNTAFSQGGLVPVFLPVWLWTNAMVQNFSGSEDLVLDGLARRMTEAPVLDSALKFYGRENIHVIHINVSNDWAFERMKSRGRNDDSDEYIKSRLSWFDRDVAPVLDYFRELKGYIYHDVNGEQDIPGVHAEIMQSLDQEK